MTPATLFHPAVAAWFERSFAGATPAQAQAWPAIQNGEHVLIAAPTGSGKTLAAFLAAIDGLVRQGLEEPLKDETQIVYVSPLKALSNDIQKNLQAPLAGIREQLRAQGLPDVDIRTWVRTGDTPSAERDKARKKPPHIVVTTPESLYILLGSESGRKMLATTRTVIVDEIHAVAPNKRGVHLAVSLERLAALIAETGGGPLQRVGLSATQKPIEEVAHFLVGAGPEGQPAPPCRIVDTGHKRARDLALEIPSSPLEAVMSNEVWDEVYDRITQLVGEHRTTLVFVNTRRLAERVTAQLSERLGETNVAAHHGSLSKEQRLTAEQRLKHGSLKALVATASLELGIDIGDVDLVCQISSPRSIASFLQRVGRAGHAVGGTSKGRLFPLSRDELVECTALIDSVQRGELDQLTIPERPLDVLAQQIVADTAAREWREDDLFALVRRAWPYRDLPRADFDAIVAMLGEGFTTRRGRRGALIHHDAVNHEIRGRRGARLTAITSGGTIPDNADYRVQMEPENIFIGTVNEDFAVESLAGDIFQLGNRSYRILRVERGTVRVEDAHGEPPSIPFWLGEAPGRSDELSQAVSRLRGDLAARLTDDATGETAIRWLVDEVGITEPPARAAGRVSRVGPRGPRLAADPGHSRVRALLRRERRHAARHPHALRQPDQPRLGPGAAQALLRQIQLRAPGGGDRGQYRAVAHLGAQLRARGGEALSAFFQRAGGAGPGAARCADVPHPLALGCRRRARPAALPRRPQGGAAARPHGSGRSRRHHLPRPDGLRREPSRRPRDSRSPAGAPDHSRLHHRGDGSRRVGAAPAGHRIGRHRGRHPRPDRAFAACARGTVGAALCLSR